MQKIGRTYRLQKRKFKPTPYHSNPTDTAHTIIKMGLELYHCDVGLLRRCAMWSTPRLSLIHVWNTVDWWWLYGCGIYDDECLSDRPGVHSWNAQSVYARREPCVFGKPGIQAGQRHHLPTHAVSLRLIIYIYIYLYSIIHIELTDLFFWVHGHFSGRLRKFGRI